MPSLRDGKPRWAAVVIVVLLVGLAACSVGGSDDRRPVASSTVTTTTTTSTSTTMAPVVTRLLAAGDIACKPGARVTATTCQMAATADLMASLRPDVVLPLGDLQYDTGRAQDFATSYEATWGRFKSLSRPVPGNHEYAGGKASGYYDYFGAAAHPPDGWYSFDLADESWHVVVLNGNCALVGGCGEGSRQYEWLRTNLESTTATCILAAWHQPRWSSGVHHSDPAYEPFWQLLAQHGADLVLGGHDHHYERFAAKQGIVQLVVGTGGRSLYPAPFAEAGTVVRNANGFGVVELDLQRGSYRGAFRPIPGNPFKDEFSAHC